MDNNEIRTTVREKYAQFAISGDGSSCCGSTSSEEGCCGPTIDEESKKLGYTDEELASIPEGANLGLGCGNPLAHASLKEGEIVLDLGSGAGIDCFIASDKVGVSGKVIGVDMTHDMISKARKNAEKINKNNVEFRLGEIENLPVADNSVDAIISNCVINLSPEKQRVFDEAFRVLKPGGRLMVSDIVLEEALPEEIRNQMSAYVGCVSGASLKVDYLKFIENSGFENIKIVQEDTSTFFTNANDPLIQEAAELLKSTPEETARLAEKTVKSAKIEAFKPVD